MTDRIAIDARLQGLAASFAGVLDWTWDGRFETVLAEFSVERKADVLGRLEQHLAGSWDSRSIADAPEAVQRVRMHLGGLMAGQLLLLSDLDTEPFAYCAWWPWGNGEKISIRIGSYGSGSDDIAALRSAFGIS